MRRDSGGFPLPQRPDGALVGIPAWSLTPIAGESTLQSRMANPVGAIEWFGEFGERATAQDSAELSAVIRDFLASDPVVRGRRDARRYVLNMAPMGTRMHDVRVELSPPDGTTVTATIPAGRPASRRAALKKLGWVLERADSRARAPYYTKRFAVGAEAPTDIVGAVDEANRTLYGVRAEGLHWAAEVWPLYLPPGAGSAESAGRAAPDGSADAPRRRRLSAKIREHPVKSILMAGIGLWTSNLVVGEMTAWVLAPPVIASMLVGGTASALLVYLVVPSAFARTAADFWETGAFGQLVGELALALVAALGWAFLLLLMFGTRAAS